VVAVSLVSGQLSIQRSKYKTSEALSPEWVSVKCPNPTRDNRLLVVTQGEHCRKHVQQIHHRYENEQARMILAVMNKVEGAADMLTGEQIELDASQLCLGFETTEEKK